MAASSYSFPLLSNQEILACLSELEVPFSEQDLTKPKYETVKPMYQSIVHLLVGITREEMQQPVFAATEALEFPELHEESIGNLAFTRALLQLMFASGVSDFALKDIYKPEYAQTRKNLSAVINFAKFREEKLTSYHELQEESEATVERKIELEEANAQLAAELEQLKAEREAEQPEADAMEKEAMDLVAQITEIQKSQAALNEEMRVLKDNSNELGSQAAAEDMKLGKAKEESKRLKSQVVSSPQKLQKSLVEIEATLESERAALVEQEKRSRDLHGRLDCVVKVEKEVKKCIKLMGEAEGEINKYKEVARGVKAAKQKISQNEEEHWQLKADQQRLRNQEGNIRQRLERVEQQANLKRQQADDAVEEQYKLARALDKENGVTEQSINENESQIRQMQTRMRDVKVSHEKEMESMMEQYESLHKQVQKYNRLLQQVMEAPPDFLPVS